MLECEYFDRCQKRNLRMLFFDEVSCNCSRDDRFSTTYISLEESQHRASGRCVIDDFFEDFFLRVGESIGQCLDKLRDDGPIRFLYDVCLLIVTFGEL